MLNEVPVWACYLMMFMSLVIAGFSQVMLKKAALKSYARWIDQYLNPLVIFAYVFFVLASFLSMMGYKKVPLSMTPVWNAGGNIFITVLAYFMLGEKPTKKKYVGLAVVVAGIVIFSL